MATAKGTSELPAKSVVTRPSLSKVGSRSPGAACTACTELRVTSKADSTPATNSRTNGGVGCKAIGVTSIFIFPIFLLQPAKLKFVNRAVNVVSSHITPQNAGVSRTLDANITTSVLFRTETELVFYLSGAHAISYNFYYNSSKQ